MMIQAGKLKLVAVHCMVVFFAFMLASMCNAEGEEQQIYFILSQGSDCPENIVCHSLLQYSQASGNMIMDDNLLLNFLPGTHFLNQLWTISNFNNVTLNGLEDTFQNLSDSAHAKITLVIDITCPTSNDITGIQVSEGDTFSISNIHIVYGGEKRCQHFRAMLSCQLISTISVSNVTIEQSPGSALKVIDCLDFEITGSFFILNNDTGIEIHSNSISMSSGKVLETALVSNTYAVSVDSETYSTDQLIQLILTDTNMSNNEDNAVIRVCFADILANNVTIVNGKHGIYLQQDCDVTPSLTVGVVGCVLDGAQVGISIVLNTVQNLTVDILSTQVQNTAKVDISAGIAIMSTDPHLITCTEQHVNIHNVTVMGLHSLSYLNDVVIISAAVLLWSVRQAVISNLSVMDNNCTGLVLLDSIVEFKGGNIFFNNSGYNGGGLAIYYGSYIVLGPSVTLQIVKNSAEQFGGGVYVSQNSLTLDNDLTTSFCFVQSSSQNCSALLNFSLNEAGIAGLDLYGGDIEQCQQKYGDSHIPYSFQSRSSDCYQLQSKVSSDPLRIVFCNQECPDETKDFSTAQPVYPGGVLSMVVAAIGQWNGTTPAVVQLDSQDIVLGSDSSDTRQRISAACTLISRLLVLQKNLQTVTLLISVADYDAVSKVLNVPITVLVDVLPCPPGFHLHNDSGICLCTESIQTLATCNITSQTIQRNSSSWILPTNKSILIYEHCPFDYCNNEPFHVDDPDEQCSHNRSGTLCGECSHGYSLSLGSNECLSCTGKEWTLPVVLIGCALAGIGLIALLIALNVNVAVGTINGLIFFVNIVKIFEALLFPDGYPNALHYFISWLNLDIGVKTCFYPGMTTCSKVALQIAFPLYLLVLIMIIIIIRRASQCTILCSLNCISEISWRINKHFGSMIMPVLSTVLLLSYTNLLHITILIYQPAQIITAECYEGTSDCENISVWYADGNVEYYSGCHGYLFAITTIIILPLLTLFTLFLLLFPVMEQWFPCFRSWRSCHARLKPWYDAYGGPYKAEYRSWTGVLLLIRCIMALVVAFENDPVVAMNVLAWMCLLLIPIITLLQVYRSAILNMLEVWYLSCLLMMVYLNQTSVPAQLSVVVGLGMFSLLLIVPYHLHLRLRKTRVCKCLKVAIFRAETYKRPNPPLVQRLNAVSDSEYLSEPFVETRQ